MVLRFEVLGPVRAWRDGSEVGLGSPQQRAVLALLLLRGGAPASPDELVAAMWGGPAPAGAVGMVRSYVSRLRRVLGSGVIASAGGGYTIDAANDVDAFERRLAAARTARRAGDVATDAAELRAALALWRGGALGGARGEYVTAERVRLETARLAAVTDLAAADLELGRHAEAAGDLAAVVEAQPLRERPRELLMLALYRSGRQAEALDVYRETRRLLADELGIEPGPELRELQRRILAADPALAGTRPAHAVPAQLPPDLPDFTGRADVLPGLLAALAPAAASVPVLGLDGLAGVGKTTLAVHIGHIGDFPDGRLFADIAATPDPLPALLHAMGAAAPAPAAERAALWRTLTAGRRLLVVLDNARDADQVRPLLPGPGGAAVVLTARRRLFGLDHVRWQKVDGLGDGEALELLAGIAGPARLMAEPDEARRFLRVASGLPQVLRAIGDRLASRPDWTLATAAQRIRPPRPHDEQRRPECGAIEAPYESALRELNAEQARAFRLLSVAEELSVAAAAAVLERSVADTEDLLESLADAHLLEPAGDLFRYLGPVRVFARGRALAEDGPEEYRAALSRFGAGAAPVLRLAVLR